MDVLVLGLVQVRAGGERIAIDRPLERAVLMRLALANGVPVPGGRLAADLWGDAVERPVQRLRVLVSRLRAALGPHAEVVGRTPAGYHATATSAWRTANGRTTTAGQLRRLLPHAPVLNFPLLERGDESLWSRDRYAIPGMGGVIRSSGRSVKGDLGQRVQ